MKKDHGRVGRELGVQAEGPVFKPLLLGYACNRVWITLKHLGVDKTNWGRALSSSRFFCYRTVEDKILVPKPPKNCVRCTRCGYLVDGPNCQVYALLRQELEENLVAHSSDFQNTPVLSNASTNVVNDPREPNVAKQDNGSFVDKIIFRAPDSPDQFHCFHCKDVLRAGETCKRCTCAKCGNESMLNRDSSVIFYSLKIDSLLDEFVGELTLLKSISPGIDKTNCHPENEIRLSQRLFDDQSLSDEDVPKKIYSNPLFDEEIIPMKIDPHSFNVESDLIIYMLNNDSSIIIPSKIDSLFDEFT
nr:hypothetical protein [Tanacetum cinerariifolium]